jgi:hypothetical protein
MGMVKRDTNRTAIKHDTIHAYTEQGIDQLLQDIYRLPHEEQYQGDLNATVIRLDLERALRSHALSPKQRVATALYYFCCLTLDECSEILDVSSIAVHYRLQNALTSISAHMRGENVRASQVINDDDIVDCTSNLFSGWLEQVAYNDPYWWIVPEFVWRDIQHKSKYTPETVEDLGAPYPWLTEKQMKWLRYKETPRPNIHRTFDNTGRKSDNGGGKQIILNKERYT